MSHRQKGPGALCSWLAALFRQPPRGLYRTPAVYQSGDRMEIQNFQKILLYDETRLCVQLPRGRFTVWGDQLRICSVTTHRLTLQGRFIRTELGDD